MFERGVAVQIRSKLEFQTDTGHSFQSWFCLCLELEMSWCLDTRVSMVSWPRLVPSEMHLIECVEPRIVNRKCTRLFPAFLFWLLVRVWRVRLTDLGHLTESGPHPSPAPLLPWVKCCDGNLFHSDAASSSVVSAVLVSWWIFLLWNDAEEQQQGHHTRQLQLEMYKFQTVFRSCLCYTVINCTIFF